VKNIFIYRLAGIPLISAR